MFSERTAWVRTPNALTERLEQLRAEGRSLVDLTETNPTRVGLSPEAGALCRLLVDPEVGSYDPDPRGLLSAREALSAHLSAPADRLLLTASTSEAYAWLFKLLCEPGDEVLVPEPSYPLFAYLAGLESVTLRPYPLRFDGEWHIDMQALSEAAGGRTRAVVVINPGNPTGAFLKQDERDRLWALCADREWALISDEVFSAYGSEPAPVDRVLRAAAPDAPALTFSLGGLSKYLALPQLKLGWMAVEGPQPLRDEALARLEVIADTYLSVNTPVQRALPRLLELAKPVQQRIRSRVAANRRHLFAARPPDAAWSVLPAEGGWTALLRIPSTIEEEAVCLELLEQGVVVQPGYYFDFPEGRWLVLSLLPYEEDFARGAGILARVLEDFTRHPPTASHS